MADPEIRSKRFHYSLELEEALVEILGEKAWYQSAGSFANPARVRQALLAWSKRIRRRLLEIVTGDDRLLLTTRIALDSFDREVRDLRPSKCTELEVLAALLSLVNRLLGFDWRMSRPNRSVFYHQTLDQQLLDEKMQRGPQTGVPVEFQKRVEVAGALHDEGMNLVQIAHVLGCTRYMVKALLVRAGRLKRGG